jgi:hypothetical protein
MVAPDVALVCTQVDAAFDALEQVDVTSLADDELHTYAMQLHRFTSRLASLRSGPTAEWVARGAWADDGSKAPWARLSREMAMSPTAAKVEVRRAEKLRMMPVTAAAFAEGKLTVDQVDVLCAAYQKPIVAVFERDETLLVDGLLGLRLPDAGRFVDYWIEQAFTEVDEERSRPDPAGRRWRAVRTFDGHIDVRGWLDPIAGTGYLNELGAIEREMFEADWAAARAEHGPDALPSQLPRTSAQRHADAQVEMARRSRAYAQGKFRRPRPLITVHVGAGTFSRMCQLADGTVVSPSQVFPLLAEADIERIVFDGPSRVIDVGVRERFFTGALRRAIEARDRHCTHASGCDVPAEDCQIDHKVRYVDGGLTVQDNGRCLCAKHNRDRENDPKQRPPPHDDE